MYTLSLHDALPIYPPYSPDLAPSDFYLFGRLKSDLQGMRFADDAVIQTVRAGVDTPPTTSFFEMGIRMLPKR
jgi:histone-lysine N-methyltransferase SETMAR